MSVSDITVLLKEDTTEEDLKKQLKEACAQPYYQGIIDCTEDELVSSDFIGNSHSGIIDLPLTKVVDGNLAKIVVWYDNEWGYSNRVVELVQKVL